MSDYFWLCVAGIVCIILAYLWGLQYGYKRGVADGRYEYVKKMLNDKYGLNPLDAVLDYGEEDKDADIQ